GIGGILEQASALAVFDLPSCFATELEVIALVVDGPGAIGFHVNSVVGRGNQLLPGERFFAGQNADIGHADDGQPVPSFSPQSSPRAAGADGVRRLTRTQVSGEQAVRDDRRALRGYTFFIERERPESRSVFLARVGNDVHQVTAI